MNKQGNTYTILYSAIMVIVVAAILAFASVSLRPLQQENIRVDKMMQILSSVHIASTAQDAVSLYDKYIGIDVASEVKQDPAKRRLPVFVCTLDNGDVKYILPLYGAGLWGPIWGYISVDADGRTLYGSYFAHQSETPGLGAEISTPAFQQQFAGKRLFVDGEFKPVAVMKKGQKPLDGADYVDAISGGTITSKGVQSMISDCLLPYESFLKSLDK